MKAKTHQAITQLALDRFLDGQQTPLQNALKDSTGDDDFTTLYHKAARRLRDRNEADGWIFPIPINKLGDKVTLRRFGRPMVQRPNPVPGSHLASRDLVALGLSVLAMVEPVALSWTGEPCR
jgi:hypothetical protein